VQVLRGMSESVVSLVLPQQERDLAISRSVVRELLAACVLRPLMTYFTPYSINQVLPLLCTTTGAPATVSLFRANTAACKHTHYLVSACLPFTHA
jgi:hypothetical protein